MKETYEKVFIRSEADLPKEAGKYIVCKTTGQMFEGYSYPMINNVAIDAQMWLKHILWYLQPISQPELSRGNITFVQ